MSGYGSAKPDANPELVNGFILEIDNIKVAAFEKCKIGAREWNVGQTRTGLDPLEMQTFSGTQKPTTIHFEKTLRVGGVSDLKALIDWSANGSKDRRGGSVTFLNRNKEVVWTIVFENAWVTLCDIPELDAMADNQAAVFPFDISISKWNFA